ncbi:MAG: hypothetical protein IPN94_22055 [Sphingobacteriales bacterium]|nr:hypothetical protein [Sphingobacteriales bacterium]
MSVSLVRDGKSIFAALLSLLIRKSSKKGIIALVSKNEADEAYKATVLTVQQNQQEALQKLSEIEKTKTVSIVDELEKLKKMREYNIITDDEFQNLKSKIINA